MNFYKRKCFLTVLFIVRGNIVQYLECVCIMRRFQNLKFTAKIVKPVLD